MKIIFFFTLLFIISFYIWKKFNSKWEELLTTQDVEKYMAIAGKLQGAGINYKTTSGGEEFNPRKNTLNSQIPPISYTIWVLKDDVYKANKIIN
jgi:flagellar biosynthesis/type III secretory pathway M-ring protein FliF/YscJ